MKSHISISSTHLWRVIQNGFAPHDPHNLTGREEVDEQLNATAKHLLQQAITTTNVLTSDVFLMTLEKSVIK
jgi:hypothetical protein